MKFYVESSTWLPDEPPINAEYPCAVLAHDNWRDYGYRTLFPIAIYFDPHTRFEHSVKILQREPDHPESAVARTLLPHRSFEQLGDEYCSLGQSIDYYERIKEAGPAFFEPFLKGLRDAAYDPSIEESFSTLEGFHTSLLRFSEAELALKEGAALLRNAVATRTFAFTFACKVPSAQEPHIVDMDFSWHPTGLNRMMVLIGRNGTGKTRFLAEFAQAMSGRRMPDPGLGFIPTRPSFSRVIAVSYSVFDDFDRPAEDSTTFSYKYCGIRSSNRATEVDSVSETPLPNSDSGARFLSMVEIRGRLQKAREEIELDPERLAIWHEVVSILLEGTVEPNDPAWATLSFYEKLSSGQRILVAIITQITAYIRPLSVLLFDEPELHLHPEVFAALARAVDKLLNKFDAYAIVATHSPMLLQETLSRQVRIFERVGNIPIVRRLATECFGETLTTITQEVFEVDGRENNFRSHLDALLASNNPDEIKAMFPMGLPLLAESYLHARGDRRRT